MSKFLVQPKVVKTFAFDTLPGPLHMRYFMFFISQTGKL